MSYYLLLKHVSKVHTILKNFSSFQYDYEKTLADPSEITTEVRI